VLLLLRIYPPAAGRTTVSGPPHGVAVRARRPAS
jgi:hypothetical protein